MLETTTRIVSENLARNIDRRRFLRRMGEALFAGVAAVATGRMSLAFAMPGGSGQPPRPVPLVPRCNPPGPYCNLDGVVSDPNGCHGSACYEHMYNSEVLQCRLWYDLYQAGCWTTPDPTIGGYWTCCDCQCGTPRIATCGCAQHSSQPVPRPDGPRGGIGGGKE